MVYIQFYTYLEKFVVLFLESIGANNETFLELAKKYVSLQSLPVLLGIDENQSHP